jgi:ubiquinone/menaquinone biosynthesis C-methylase UbiE
MRAVELNTFLEFCNKSELKREILECGAGVGDSSVEPLFVRFNEHGYRVHGIELSEERAAAATAYCRTHQVEADLRVGDMRQLPFEDEAMSFIFSYNVTFHMTKVDIAVAMGEIERVLKQQGLCFVNFLSVDSDSYRKEKDIGSRECPDLEAGDEHVHAYFEEDEADQYFVDFNVLHKEKRVRERRSNGQKLVSVFIDYIAKKN